eukprot:Skav230114  [mRNA]  locus=scaffold5021:524:1078:+ [translate_table: standard]
MCWQVIVWRWRQILFWVEVGPVQEERRFLPCQAHQTCKSSPEKLNKLSWKRLAGEVEQAFMEAPSSGLVALMEDPLKNFEFDDLICAHKYVMEHSLCSWIEELNHDRGVAPSREQILTQALASISFSAPEPVRRALRKAVSGAPRQQRRWLARFRKRWGAKIGMLQAQEDVPMHVRKQKVGNMF